MQWTVGECVEGWLDELPQARDADDGAVDAAKGGEAKDFGGIVAKQKGQWTKLYASMVGLLWGSRG